MRPSVDAVQPLVLAPRHTLARLYIGTTSILLQCVHGPHKKSSGAERLAFWPAITEAVNAARKPGEPIVSLADANARMWSEDSECRQHATLFRKYLSSLALVAHLQRTEIPTYCPPDSPPGKIDYVSSTSPVAVHSGSSELIDIPTFVTKGAHKLLKVCATVILRPRPRPISRRKCALNVTLIEDPAVLAKTRDALNQISLPSADWDIHSRCHITQQEVHAALEPLLAERTTRIKKYCLSEYTQKLICKKADIHQSYTNVGYYLQKKGALLHPMHFKQLDRKRANMLTLLKELDADVKWHVRDDLSSPLKTMKVVAANATENGFTNE